MKSTLQPTRREEVRIPSNSHELVGDLMVPGHSIGTVLFAHGSGSSRHSSRNRFVAQRLHEGNLGTLLMDLLSAEEEALDIHTAHLRFDIPLLAARLLSAIDWLNNQDSLRDLPIGLFGASTGAAAALMAGARMPRRVAAIVSRGGRPDLAGDDLASVRAPTLLIVGGDDDIVIDLNKEAQDRITCPTELKIIPRAGHLFEEPGALERVADLAREWFLRHLH